MISRCKITKEPSIYSWPNAESTRKYKAHLGLILSFLLKKKMHIFVRLYTVSRAQTKSRVIMWSSLYFISALPFVLCSIYPDGETKEQWDARINAKIDKRHKRNVEIRLPLPDDWNGENIELTINQTRQSFPMGKKSTVPSLVKKGRGIFIPSGNLKKIMYVMEFKLFY